MILYREGTRRQKGKRDRDEGREENKEQASSFLYKKLPNRGRGESKTTARRAGGNLHHQVRGLDSQLANALSEQGEGRKAPKNERLSNKRAGEEGRRRSGSRREGQSGLRQT